MGVGGKRVAARATLRFGRAIVKAVCASGPHHHSAALLSSHPAPTPPAPQPLSITLKGITNDGVDPGIDTFRTVTLPLVQRLAGLEGGLELKVRGGGGGGEEGGEGGWVWLEGGEGWSSRWGRGRG